MALANWLEGKKLITFVGTGGVGKTSLSLLAAITGARQGLRVAAITIDPSRRLSTVLNLGEQATQTSSLNWSDFAHPLQVFYVDTPKLFSQFVAEHLSSDLFRRLSENRIYQQISQQLRETHNFASLYQMNRVMESGEFDLVVLDTPPCHQVLDFFESPQKLQSFFAYQMGGSGEGWLSWVKDQGIKVAEQVLHTLVGPDFVQEMDHFFRGVGGLRQSIHQMSTSFNQALTAPDSHLTLVFSGDLDKQDEARYLQKSLLANRLPVGTLVLNRAFVPDLEQLPRLTHASDDFESRLYTHWVEQKQRSTRILGQMAETFGSAQKILLPEIHQSLRSEQDLRKFIDLIVPYWLEVES